MRKPLVELPRVKSILSDPVIRRERFIRLIMSTQLLSGITTTYADAARAYDVVQAEKKRRGLV